LNTSFDWTRSVAIAAALALHLALALWVTGASEPRGAIESISDVLVWGETPYVPVVLTAPVESARQADAAVTPTRMLSRKQDDAAGDTVDGIQRSSGPGAPRQVSSEWHRQPEQRFEARNPMEARSGLDYTPTRFSKAWIPQGDAMDQLALRFPVVAIIRNAAGYRKPCTDEEKKQRLPRCFPPGSEPEGY